jgi:outer membrane protein OmpA-like peptidoglycan-associated protein
MKLKNILSVLIAIFFISPLFAEVKESQAKIEIEDANKAYNQILDREDIKRYIPYYESYFSRAYSYMAEKAMKDGDYDKASFYAILTKTTSEITVYKAETFKQELENITKERNYYKALSKKLSKADVAFVLLKMGLKRKGRSKTFEGSFEAKKIYGFKRSPRKAYDVNDLTAKAQTNLNELHSVMKDQKKTKLKIVSFSVKDRRRKSDISEEYAKKIKNYLIDKGNIDDSRIKIVAKGRKKPPGQRKKKDMVILTLTKVKIAK